MKKTKLKKFLSIFLGTMFLVQASDAVTVKAYAAENASVENSEDTAQMQNDGEKTGQTGNFQYGDIREKIKNDIENGELKNRAEEIKNKAEELKNKKEEFDAVVQDKKDKIDKIKDDLKNQNADKQQSDETKNEDDKEVIAEKTGTINVNIDLQGEVDLGKVTVKLYDGTNVVSAKTITLTKDGKGKVEFDNLTVTEAGKHYKVVVETEKGLVITAKKDIVLSLKNHKVDNVDVNLDFDVILPSLKLPDISLPDLPNLDFDLPDFSLKVPSLSVDKLKDLLSKKPSSAVKPSSGSSDKKTGTTGSTVKKTSSSNKDSKGTVKKKTLIKTGALADTKMLLGLGSVLMLLGIGMSFGAKRKKQNSSEI